MLTTVRAYSSWESVDTLLLADGGRAETDLLQVRDITGLEPVEATINTIPFGSFDGDSYVGSSVSRRNIVMTIKPNPDWFDWTYEKLRRILYKYFMPKRRVRLVFETDEIAPVEIIGYVESIDPAIFSKDGEIQISVICPQPYFTAVTPTILTGITNDAPIEFNYDGSVETAINLEVSHISGEPGTSTFITIGHWHDSTFVVSASIDIDEFNYLVINSSPGNKYIRTVNLDTSIIVNVLSQLQQGAVWPILRPGLNPFSVSTAGGDQAWKLTYFKKYGGL